VFDEYVCLSLCHVTRKLHGRTSPNLLSMLPTGYARGLGLIWQHCDTLCTSGFAADVILSHSGPMARHAIARTRQA